MHVAETAHFMNLIKLGILLQQRMISVTKRIFSEKYMETILKLPLAVHSGDSKYMK